MFGISRIWGFFSLVFALSASAGLETAQALEGIGYVKGVRVNAYGTPPARTRNSLYALDIVVSNEVVETIRRGALHLVFHDGSNFRLGSDSRATLDRFVYDPNSKTGQFELNLRSGIFRLKTGRMKKEGILVITPVAFISVTGTDFVVQVLAGGAIIVAVIVGQVTISPLFPGAVPAVVTAGSAVAVGTDGQVTSGVPAPLGDSGLGDFVPGADREGEGGAGDDSKSDAGPAASDWEFFFGGSVIDLPTMPPGAAAPPLRTTPKATMPSVDTVTGQKVKSQGQLPAMAWPGSGQYIGQKIAPSAKPAEFTSGN